MEKIEILEKSVAILVEEIKSLRESVSKGFVKVDSNFTIVSNRLAELEKQVKEMKFKIENLDGTTAKGLNEVGTKIESLTEEISKINAVTSYDDQFKNLQKFSN